MARRDEVFQSKVLQKLYPAAPKSEKEPSPPRFVEALAKKPYVKRKASQEDTATGDAGKRQSAATPGRRMYTVLPPPADYKAEQSVTPPQLGSINSAEDPAEESIQNSSDELDRNEEKEDQRRKRRRRKNKPALQKDGAALQSESSAGQSQTAVDEGGECISRNRKRKLKKKRHREKLLSMGLMPRAAALEFTYQRDGEEGEEEEEEENERRAVEVSDFLRTTMEIYMADSSCADRLPLLSETVGDLLSSIASAHKPTAALRQLHALKAFVQHRETDKVEKALEELSSTSPLSAEETTAVVSLFQYWITDILPMQRDKQTGLSTEPP